MQAYNQTARLQQTFATQWTGLRSFNNRVKALLTQYVVLNATEKELGNTFIDAACGRGGDIQKWDSSAQIAQQNIEVWGIDIAQDAVREANRRFEELKCQHVSFMALTGDVTMYGGETDRCLAGMVMHFCINYLWKPSLDALLENMHKSMIPQSIVSVIFTNHDNLNLAPFDMVTPHTDTEYSFTLGGLVNNVPEYKVTLKQLVERFERHRFKTLHAWSTLGEASQFLAPISRFLKPPKPMTDVELNITKCYGVCVFVATE